jgi:hypothetical protein
VIPSPEASADRDADAHWEAWRVRGLAGDVQRVRTLRLASVMAIIAFGVWLAS